MARPETREVAEQLFHRADSDLRACRKLTDDDEMGDEVVGFHAQQAVEKAIKVAHTLAGASFPRTHDVTFLASLAKHSGVTLPDDLANADWLTSWAADLRYDEPSTALDRADALHTAEVAVRWARGVLTDHP